MKLTSKQVSYLKSQAHHLQPIFQIGKNGLSAEQVNQINDALEKRELIKISLLQSNLESPKETAEIIADKSGANIIQVIGKVIVLFKKSSKKENREISLTLPKA